MRIRLKNAQLFTIKRLKPTILATKKLGMHSAFKQVLRKIILVIPKEQRMKNTYLTLMFQILVLFKQFMVELFSARAGFYIKQNQADKG